MRQINLNEFHQAKPVKNKSDGAFRIKYYFDQSEEKGGSLLHGKTALQRLNRFRKAANDMLLDCCHGNNVALQNSRSNASFNFNPYLAIIYDIDNSEPSQADALIKTSCIQFKEIYTLSDLQALDDFHGMVRNPYFLLPYHLVEMLKNEAEWRFYETYLNFNIKSAKIPSKYLFQNQGAFCCLTNFKSTNEPIQRKTGENQTLSIHGLTAYKLYQAIIHLNGAKI